MTISNLKIKKMFKKGHLKAIFSVTIDNCVEIHQIKVIQIDTVNIVVMPRKKDKNGIYQDMISITSPESKKELEDYILEAYKKYILIGKALETK